MKKELLLIIIFFALSKVSYSRAIVQTYTNITDNVCKDVVTGIDLKSDGYLVGGNAGSGYGSYDYYITKLSTSGNIEWQKRYGGSGSDKLNSIIKTSYGYMLIGVSFSDSSGNKTINNYVSGKSDIWIIKIDVFGNKLGEKIIGSSLSDTLVSAKKLSNGNIILYESSSSPAGFDKSQNSVVISGGEYWLVEITENGNIVREKTIHNINWEEKIGDFIELSNGYLCAGLIGSRPAITRLNYNLDTLWTRDYYNQGFNAGTFVAQSKDKKYFYVLGNAFVSSTYNHYVYKIDTSGNVIWVKNYLNQNGSVSKGIFVNDSGKIDIACTNYGANYYGFMQIDTAGNEEWRTNLGSGAVYYSLQTAKDEYLLFANNRSNSLVAFRFTKVIMDNSTSGSIKGNTFMKNSEADPSCSYESRFDANLNNILIVVNPGDYRQLSTTNGSYNFNLDTGSYTVKCYQSAFNPLFSPKCIDSAKVRVQISDRIVDSVNFAMKAPPHSINVAIGITSTRFRIGRSALVAITIKNLSLDSVLNAEIVLRLTDSLRTITATPNFDSISPTKRYIKWKIPRLNGQEVKTYWLKTAIPNDVNLIGKTVGITATANPYSTDIYQPNNTDNITITYVGSFDPNEKVVTPIGAGTEGQILKSDSILRYTIHFQNLGNDTAYKVVIRDTISAKLKLSSINFINSSHPCKYYITNNMISFTFDSINLPAAIQDSLRSQGFLTYSIKLSDAISFGDKISNTAHVFFDENPAINTNTTLNTVVSSISVNNTSAGVDKTICQGQNVTLTVTGAATYIWNTGQNTPSITVSPASTTNYVVTGIINSISKKDTVTVYVNQLKTTNIEQIISQGQSYNFNGISLTTPGTYRDTLQQLNGCDSFIVLNLTVLTSIKNNISFATINIFPNPADNFITLDILSKKSVPFKITLITVDGKIIQTKEVNSTPAYNEKIDVSALSTGILYLKVESENEESTFYILKQ